MITCYIDLPLQPKRFRNFLLTLTRLLSLIIWYQYDHLIKLQKKKFKFIWLNFYIVESGIVVAIRCLTFRNDSIQNLNVSWNCVRSFNILFWFTFWAIALMVVDKMHPKQTESSSYMNICLMETSMLIHYIVNLSFLDEIVRRSKHLYRCIICNGV